MIFSSTVFLFLFLPLLLLLYYLTPSILKNSLLLIASLSFYYWGAQNLFWVILVSIVVDYLCGSIQSRSNRLRVKQCAVAASVCVNLGLLAYFKYFDFFIENINEGLAPLGLEPFSTLNLVLPIGISFYTFQTISYQIDLYRGVVKHQRNFIDFSLFVSLFPQLVAGPIVRYSEIEHSIKKRSVTLDMFAVGAQRFVIGLGKKVLLADPIGLFADYAFSREADALPFQVAWLGAAAFTLQVYFDFAAYSDMAIGLGRMFGFTFPENFRYPLAARSLREFWQHWHMTLTRWFRDYLYAAIKSRSGSKRSNQLLMVAVFVLVGFWHGASWTFILWGLYHGILLLAERRWLGRYVKKWPLLLQHLYLLFLVVLSAVFFRAESLSQAFEFVRAMFGFNLAASLDASFFVTFDREIITLLLLGAVASTPWPMKLLSGLAGLPEKIRGPGYLQWVAKGVASLAGVALLWLCFVWAAAAVVSGYKNPFIYFRF